MTLIEELDTIIRDTLTKLSPEFLVDELIRRGVVSLNFTCPDCDRTVSIPPDLLLIDLSKIKEEK